MFAFMFPCLCMQIATISSLPSSHSASPHFAFRFSCFAILHKIRFVVITNVKMLILLPTITMRHQQQIAILIISFFTYVAGIRNMANNNNKNDNNNSNNNNNNNNNKNYINNNNNNSSSSSSSSSNDNKNINNDNMLHPTLQNSNYESFHQTLLQTPPTFSSSANAQQKTQFRPVPIIDFTSADAIAPERINPAYMANDRIAYADSHKHISRLTSTSNTLYTKSDNKRLHASDTKKQMKFSFPSNSDKPLIQSEVKSKLLPQIPILTYMDPYTNENYHYRPAENEGIVTTHNINSHNDKKESIPHNQEYLVQSSITVGSNKQQQQHQHQQQQQQEQTLHYLDNGNHKITYPIHSAYVMDEKPNYQKYGQTPNALVVDKRPENWQTTAHTTNKISYDSHDYPPPSYYQHQTSNFLPFTATPTPSFERNEHRVTSMPHLQSSSLKSTLPNYANNIDNYLPKTQQTHHYHRRPTLAATPPYPPANYTKQQASYYHDKYSLPPQRIPSPPSPPSPPSQSPSLSPTPPQLYQQWPTMNRLSYHNYYDYHAGDVSPPISRPLSPAFNYPYQRPTLTTYQEPYKPFVASKLNLGVTGGSTTNKNNPLNSLLSALTRIHNINKAPPPSLPLSSAQLNQQRPINSQLVKTLENIARNDDLQCVPKVLCQMVAGQTQHGQLPSIITSPTVTNFLAGFPVASPALIYGRAVLLGISGGESSCQQTYTKCPKNEYEVIYYLNNHRGGFFKLFSESNESSHHQRYPEQQQQQQQNSQHPGYNDNSATQGGDGGYSLFNILAALTGAGGSNSNKIVTATATATTTTLNSTPKPQTTNFDLMSGIGNFFAQMLSDYMGGIGNAMAQHQSKRLRRSSKSYDMQILKFNDTINLKTQTADGETNIYGGGEDMKSTQRYATFKDYKNEEHLSNSKKIIFLPEINENLVMNDTNIINIIDEFNHFNQVRKLKFPTIPPISDKAASAKAETKKIVFKNDGQRTLVHPESHDSIPLSERNPKIVNRLSDSIQSNYDKNSTKETVFKWPDDKKTSSQNFFSFDYIQNNLNPPFSFHHIGDKQTFTFLPTPSPSVYVSTPKSHTFQGIIHQSYELRPNSRPYASNAAIRSSASTKVKFDSKNIYVTNAQGVTEYYLTPDGRKVYL
ncbi:uncharacterized protein ACN427_004530 isoform 2-T2 [Glossina fuscipes fuscipes]